MTAESRDTPVVAEERQGLSAAGSATFDIALRMGGLFLAIIVVAVVIFILKPSSFNVDVGISVLRAMSSVAIMSLGLTPGHRRRRDRPLLRRDVRPRRQCAGGDVDHVGHPDLRRAAARDRDRRGGRPVQRPARHRPPHPVLHRHARELQPPLRRLAVDHEDLDLQPGLSAAGRDHSRERAQFLHRHDGELRRASDLARGAVDAGARGDRRLARSTARCSASG